MKTTMTWLLAGAALTLCAGAGVALAADPAEAIRQAQEDAARVQIDAGRVRVDAERARADGERARAEAMKARDEAMKARDEARRELRVHRGDRDVIVYRGHGDRAESLTTLLQLRPEQEPALKAFLEATRPNRDNMVRFDRRVDDDRSTMQRLDEMSARAATQKAETDRKIAAVKTFYGQLDAKQKKTFDAMPMLMMVGPNIGPMMIPTITPIHFEHFAPPVPPVPPSVPRPPRAPVPPAPPSSL